MQNVYHQNYITFVFSVLQKKRKKKSSALLSSKYFLIRFFIHEHWTCVLWLFSQVEKKTNYYFNQRLMLTDRSNVAAASGVKV